MADQRKTVALARRLHAVDEMEVPVIVPRQGQRQQGRGGTRPFSSEVGEIDGNQLPADAGRRI